MLTRDEAARLLQENEALLEEAVALAVRNYLERVQSATLVRPTLTAAAIPDPTDPTDYTMLTLGTMYGWWAEEVDAVVAAAVSTVFQQVYDRATDKHDGDLEATSLDGFDRYMGRVRDRLVQGIQPPLPVDAFDRVRVAVTEGAVEGWSRSQTAQRIAANLSWETQGEYWRGVKEHYGQQIDAILDPLGPPGTPAREAARLHDPRVQALRNKMNAATRELDAEKSYWEVRATRIARTESTGAQNYAMQQALLSEGWAFKEWCSGHDSRTRDEHMAADGQIVKVDAPFVVGTSNLQFPGDPAGPARLIINCRCFMVGADSPDGEEPPTPPDAADFEWDSPGRELEALTDDQLDERFAELTSLGIWEGSEFDAIATEYDRRSAYINLGTAASDLADSGARWQVVSSAVAPLRSAAEENRRQLRNEYVAWTEVQELRAEEETRGNLISAQGRKVGATPHAYITGRLRKTENITEEFQRWLADNKPMSWTAWSTGKGPRKGWGSEFG